MKVAYLGGTRGYQSAVYRPGQGWSGTVSHRRFVRQRRVSKTDRYVHVCPLTVARRRRPGIRTKTFIVSSVVVVAAALTVVLSGGARL
jgi:hypothetical protein